MPDESLNGVFDLGAALGAEKDFAVQCFTVYVPNQDKNGVEFGTQRKWVLEAIELLTELNGGATAMPPAEGAWRSGERRVVWEHPVVVYSYIDPGPFHAALPRVREFLHRMGRETNQGEVAFEFCDKFYLIRKYDAPASSTGGQT